jgi:hypothetical protein
VIRWAGRAIAAWAKLRADLIVENLCLRQQLIVLQRRAPRPRLRDGDRRFWILVCRRFPTWRDWLLVVQPDTVLRWHRQGWTAYWRWRSRRRRRGGRPRLRGALRALIRRMSAENPLWGQRRVQAELARLGFPVSARAVAKYMRRPHDGVPSPTWRKLLKDQATNIWACDFFGVRTVFFRTLYVFFVMHHETRQILQVRVTRHPTADWAAQQVVEACDWGRDPPRYLIRDRDSRYGEAFNRRVRGLGVRQLRTPVKAPRANALAERWVRSVRTECLDQVLIVNERQLQRVLDEYVAPTSMRGVPIGRWASGRHADQLRRPSPTPQAGSLVGRCLGACTMCISMQPDGRLELLRPTRAQRCRRVLGNFRCDTHFPSGARPSCLMPRPAHGGKVLWKTCCGFAASPAAECQEMPTREREVTAT